MANAMRQMTETRHDDGQRAQTWHQAVMREVYAKITERGLGHLHAIVSHKALLFNTLLLFHHFSYS